MRDVSEVFKIGDELPALSQPQHFYDEDGFAIPSEVILESPFPKEISEVGKVAVPIRPEEISAAVETLHLPGEHDQEDHDPRGGGGKGEKDQGESKTKGTGTKEDPVRTSDVNEAVKALGEGKHVRLNQPREVSTLMNKLADVAEESKRLGEKAPMYDLCNVSVEDTNLFCAENVGVPRIEMPQLGGEPTPGTKADELPRDERNEVHLDAEFIKHLEGTNRDVETTHEKASYLRASQTELNGAKVAGIMRAIENGVELEGSIFVTKDNYILDGHHRWAAQVGLDAADGTLGDEGPDMPIHRIDMPILEALDEARGFAAEWGIPQVSAR